MSTESFFLLCKKANLTMYDLENMTLYMVIRYLDEFVNFGKEENPTVRRATQEDYDRF